MESLSFCGQHLIQNFIRANSNSMNLFGSWIPPGWLILCITNLSILSFKGPKIFSASSIIFLLSIEFSETYLANLSIRIINKVLLSTVSSNCEAV